MVDKPFRVTVSGPGAEALAAAGRKFMNYVENQPFDEVWKNSVANRVIVGQDGSILRMSRGLINRVVASVPMPTISAEKARVVVNSMVYIGLDAYNNLGVLIGIFVFPVDVNANGQLQEIDIARMQFYPGSPPPPVYFGDLPQNTGPIAAIPAGGNFYEIPCDFDSVLSALHLGYTVDPSVGTPAVVAYDYSGTATSTSGSYFWLVTDFSEVSASPLWTVTGHPGPPGFSEVTGHGPLFYAADHSYLRLARSAATDIEVPHGAVGHTANGFDAGGTQCILNAAPLSLTIGDGGSDHYEWRDAWTTVSEYGAVVLSGLSPLFADGSYNKDVLTEAWNGKYIDDFTEYGWVSDGKFAFIENRVRYNSTAAIFENSAATLNSLYYYLDGGFRYLVPAHVPGSKTVGAHWMDTYDRWSRVPRTNTINPAKIDFIVQMNGNPFVINDDVPEANEYPGYYGSVAGMNYYKKDSGDMFLYTMFAGNDSGWTGMYMGLVLNRRMTKIKFPPATGMSAAVMLHPTLGALRSYGDVRLLEIR